MADENTEDQMEAALALVYGAIHVSNDALRSNPSKVEKRILLKRRARLEAERADLEGMLDALADGEAIDVDAPTDQQVNDIADLTGKVEQQRRADVTIAAALEITGDVLVLATELTGG